MRSIRFAPARDFKGKSGEVRPSDALRIKVLRNGGGL
jgi:hypothetical protein